jgi:hypothetical protein
MQDITLIVQDAVMHLTGNIILFSQPHLFCNYRNELKAARSSSEKSLGCSHAAK